MYIVVSAVHAVCSMSSYPDNQPVIRELECVWCEWRWCCAGKRWRLIGGRPGLRSRWRKVSQLVPVSSRRLPHRRYIPSSLPPPLSKMPPEMIPIDGEGQRKRVVCLSQLFSSLVQCTHLKRTYLVLLLRLGRQWIPLWSRTPVGVL